MSEAFIIDAVRVAGGRRKGRLANVHAVDLGAMSLNALLERTSFDPAAVEDVIFGCVTQAGEQSQHVGRNCVLASKLPQSVPAVTIDRQCGSSQQAVHFAAQAVMSGVQDLVIAGGVESMTRAPMNSAVIGAQPLSPAEKKRFDVTEFSQFVGAEMIAKKWGFDRDTLDRFALESHRRAAAAINAGAFKNEIVPVPGDARGWHGSAARPDEGVRFDASLEGARQTRTDLAGRRADGRQCQPDVRWQLGGAGRQRTRCEAAWLQTAGTHRQHDGHCWRSGHHARRTAVCDAEGARSCGPEAQRYRSVRSERSVRLGAAGMAEALGRGPGKLNVNGGAIALGHPLGATGGKLMATLVHALRARKKKYGLQTMCEGGGIANVTIVEVL